MEFIKRNYIWIIAIIVIISLYFIFKPNIGKSLYKFLKKEYETTDVNISKKIDSIQKLRERDLQTYNELIANSDRVIEEMSQKLDKANLKIKQNEKLINDYRSGDFDQRFSKFSKLITGKDDVQR